MMKVTYDEGGISEEGVEWTAACWRMAIKSVEITLKF